MESDIYYNFFKWLNSGDSYYPKLELQNRNGYRTITSKNPISNGEKIMSIPLDLIITYEKALKSKLNTTLKGMIDCEHTVFTLFLLEEKEIGDKSFWKPYLDILPRDFNNMALYFDDNLLKILGGTLALDKIKGRRAQLKLDYDKICMAEPSFGGRFTLDEFIWGRLVTITRIFGFSVNGQKTSGLVPLADMLNHKNPDRNTSATDTSWDFDNTSQTFRIVSNKNIKSGREVYDSYGFKCNSRFFVNYGFTVDDNDDDDETSIFEGKFHITGFYRATREGSEKTSNMFNDLRRKVINDYNSKVGKWDRELKILEILQQEIFYKISEFKEDYDTYVTLSQQESDFKKKCCYIMCLSELKILKKFERLCVYLIPILYHKKLNKIMDKKGRLVKSGSVLIDEYLTSILK